MYALWYITLSVLLQNVFCQPVSPEGADQGGGGMKFPWVHMHPFITHDTPWTQIEAFCVRWSLPPSPLIKLLQPLPSQAV